jgi:hypothetical protein
VLKTETSLAAIKLTESSVGHLTKLSQGDSEQCGATCSTKIPSQNYSKVTQRSVGHLAVPKCHFGAHCSNKMPSQICRKVIQSSGGNLQYQNALTKLSQGDSEQCEAPCSTKMPSESYCKVTQSSMGHFAVPKYPFGAPCSTKFPHKVISR